MSGGGGSDFGGLGTGGGGGMGGIPCEALTFRDTLASPVPTVVATLSVGQALDIEADGYSVAAVAPAGRAGTLLNNMSRLMECLQAGHMYKADIVSITGGTIRVQVRPE